MPEGDVLARCAQTLGQALDGTRLTTAQLRWPNVDPGALVGQTVTQTLSYGKNLFQRTGDGWTLHTHLRMDGAWRTAPAGSPAAARLARTPHARVLLGNDATLCVGLDIGMVNLVRTRDEHTIVDRLGPDLLAADFEGGNARGGLHAGATPTPTGLQKAVSNAQADPSRPICEVLLDQRVVAGIGTIYMAESLFALRIWPWTPVAQLAGEDIANLLLAARRLMQRVVVGGFGARTSHAHARRGKPCHRCGTPIARGTANALPYERPVFYCPHCQPEPR
ncbi:DNA-formamidopyrimidine glycosylase family protein [Rarobacter incanus]|uniref:DNA-(apurinic or apyrimidinic site) lyase n=1 Tax=Rarobacter incanus TaxID=153494 RepID=A0A542SPT3_9MICO|nr:DNA-formamidopyrimidine glycosylase family protein [Rarobacter incanus]TQK76588.1 endonuclease-8 [Rarobacter incanus]